MIMRAIDGGAVIVMLSVHETNARALSDLTWTSACGAVVHDDLVGDVAAKCHGLPMLPRL